MKYANINRTGAGGTRRCRSRRVRDAQLVRLETELSAQRAEVAALREENYDLERRLRKVEQWQYDQGPWTSSPRMETTPEVFSACELNSNDDNDNAGDMSVGSVTTSHTSMSTVTTTIRSSNTRSASSSTGSRWCGTPRSGRTMSSSTRRSSLQQLQEEYATSTETLESSQTE